MYNMDTKQCCRCKEIKDTSEFFIDNYRKDKLNIYCKECIKIRTDRHRAAIKKYQKQYRLNHRQEIKLYNTNYYELNGDKIKENAKIYRRNNKDKKSKADLLYQKERTKNDPIYRLINRIRSNINGSFKRRGYTKKSKTYKILGCDYIFFKEYIESKFTEGMTFDNAGNNGWHLDHIIPLASAKTEEDVYKLCHYTNFQPLWKDDNIKKCAKIPPIVQLKLL